MRYGLVAAVTDPSGTVAATYQYDPYGNVTSQTGSLYNPFQYASGWQSDITNFTHFGHRWYAPLPEYGRWTQQDPVAGSLGNPISQCRYAYANDDPVNLTDTSGRDLWTDCITQATIAGWAGLAGGAITGFITGLFTGPGVLLATLVGALAGGVGGIVTGCLTAILTDTL